MLYMVFRIDISAPFGAPVVPPVYRIIHVSLPSAGRVSNALDAFSTADR